ncbi:hypothetical protein FGB62_12g127 [Gracilaria domingensis]|nr:hypothetical protein FGB62_12g127 [Gracilaria domingensis]
MMSLASRTRSEKAAKWTRAAGRQERGAKRRAGAERHAQRTSSELALSPRESNAATDMAGRRVRRQADRFAPARYAAQLSVSMTILLTCAGAPHATWSRWQRGMRALTWHGAWLLRESGATNGVRVLANPISAPPRASPSKKDANCPAYIRAADPHVATRSPPPPHQPCVQPKTALLLLDAALLHHARDNHARHHPGPREEG